jgi:superfamily II DNA/RNA helicase
MRTFQELGLSNRYIESLSKQQITSPTEIQIESYPIVLNHRDVWLSAPTGSGKTLAYILPLLAVTDSESTALQIAILSPTQELAVQIYDCICNLESDKTSTLRTQLLIGNASAQRQKEKLKKKPHIVVGTLGRMLELARTRKLKLHQCKSVVIDEADNMLAEDRIADVEAFIKMMPRDRQLIFTSATQKGDSYFTAESLSHELKWIASSARQEEQTVRTEHRYVETRYHHKAKALHQLLQTLAPERAIVFVHRNLSAEELGDELIARHPQTTVLHGNLSKFERQKALDRFRRGKITVLIASDVAARGLDIKGVTHIFNVDLPSSSDDYIHRAGRTGRMGASGQVISLPCEDELKLIRRYERDLNIRIKPLDLND